MAAPSSSARVLRRAPSRRGAAAIATALLAATWLLQAALPAGVLAAGGNLDHLTVAVVGTPNADGPISLSLTAKDANDRTVRNYDGFRCLVFTGASNSPNGTGPTYPAQGSCAGTNQSRVSFSNGVATPQVFLRLAASTQLTVTDPAIPFGGTSAAFVVRPGTTSSLSFTGGPIDTKVGTPIYHTCVPDPAGVKPCAATTQTPASSPVRVLARDAWGNFAATTVTIGIAPAATGLGSAATNASGVASFGDTLTINTTGAAILRARADGTTTDSAPIQVVFDLKACDAGGCRNSVDNGLKNVQRAVNTLSTSGDFFVAGSTNVLLTTSFFEPSTVGPQCGLTSFIGQGTEARVEGDGIGATQPTTTMLLIVPKRSLQAFGVASRNADSFDVCLGAIRLDGGSTPWTAKNAAGNLVPSVADGSTFWGTVADCTAFAAGSANPCAAVKTKNVSEVQSYFTSIGDTGTAASIPSLMSNSDLAIVVRKGYPFDGKAMLH